MPASVRRAFDSTEDLLDRIVQECDALGSELLIAVKRPTNELRWLNRFPALRDYDFNPDIHHEWFSEYAASRGIHYLDLGGPLQEYYDAHPTGDPEQYSWPLDGHLREPGHELVAQLIHEYLIQNGLIEKEQASD